jgi:hypothetical protein
MPAPLGSDPTNGRLGWAVAHLPSRATRDRAAEPEAEGDDRSRREKR